MSTREDRRLQLELLSMRAELQRMELRQQVQDVKDSVQWSRMLVAGFQRLMGSPGWSQGSALVRQFASQYPMLAMVGSVGFGLFRKRILRIGVRAALFGAIGGGLYWWWSRSRLPQMPARDITAAGSSVTAITAVPSSSNAQS